VYKLRLKLSYYLLRLGVWVIPDDNTRNKVRMGLAVGGQAILEDLSD